MLSEYLKLAAGYALYNNLNLLIPFALFCLQMFDIRYYIICGEKDEIRKILKVLEKDTNIRSTCSKYINGRTVMTGFFANWWCVGYLDNISRYDEDCRIYLIASSATYKQITEDKSTYFSPISFVNDDAPGGAIATNSSDTIEPVQIKVFMRVGQFKNFYYSSIMMDMTHIEPIGEQETVMNSCLDIFKAKGRATIFIHGVSNAGKSSIGYLLAKQLNGYFCHSFNPTDPGDCFSTVLNEMKSRDYDDRPIIIVLNEVDDIIKTFHETIVPQNREIPISVRNKLTWTTFLDDMVFWKNVLFVMTSNTSKETIDTWDPAYLGKGRVHASFKMMSALNIDN